MPTWQTIGRRMVMRYTSGSAFSFTKLSDSAEDQGIYDLAGAIASVQRNEPERVSVVETRMLRA